MVEDSIDNIKIIECKAIEKVKKPNLTNSQRQKIYETLLEASLGGKLPHGILTRLGKQFKVSSLTISRIWNQGRRSLSEGSEFANVNSQIPLKSGRKRKPINLEIIEGLPEEGRTSFKAISNYTKIPKSTLFDALKGCLVKKGNIYCLKRDSRSQSSKNCVNHGLSKVEK